MIRVDIAFANTRFQFLEIFTAVFIGILIVVVVLIVLLVVKMNAMRHTQ